MKHTNQDHNEDHNPDSIPVDMDWGCTYIFNPNYCPPGQLANKPYLIEAGEECEDPTETSCVTPICPDTEECVEFLPCLDIKKEGCNWYNTVGIPSTPPQVPCAPHKVGRGQFGGGVAAWTLSIPSKANKMLLHCKPQLTKYIQSDWDSILNLNSHPEWQSNLVVRRERGEQNMTVAEFMNMSSKIDCMIKLIEEFNGITSLDSSNIGLGLVKLPKTNPTDPDTYGLSALVNGSATGNPLPLVSQVDGSGVITGLLLPLPA